MRMSESAPFVYVVMAMAARWNRQVAKPNLEDLVSRH